MSRPQTKALTVIGPFTIRAVHSGKCLDVVGGRDAVQDGARVQQFICLGPAQFNQHWHWFSTDSIRIGADGYLVSRHSSGKFLDVIGGPRATGDGATACSQH